LKKAAALILRAVSLALSAGMVALALTRKITLECGVLMLGLGQACLTLSLLKAFNGGGEDKP
jgi:hypothetical protein